MRKPKKITTPNYKQIYTDILNIKYPEKKEICSTILEKSQLSALDVIELNKRIFSNSLENNQKYNSYPKSVILEILDFQKKEKLNNTQLASHFNLSKNTITKWKNLFP